MNFTQKLQELLTCGREDLHSYNGWAVGLSEEANAMGYRVVHIEDNTIGITSKGKDPGWVRVYPGSDYVYGEKVVRKMIANNNIGVDDGNELYCIIPVKTDFPFVLSDPTESLYEDDTAGNPLRQYVGNTYPEEYAHKVFGNYSSEKDEIVREILEMLKNL